ncbi:MAG TPA: LapA family protein [Candidatus Paceibacterota bacterium]
MILALILGIILGAGLTVFTLQNATLASVSLLAWHFSAPLAFVLLCVIGVAVIATLLGLLPTVYRSESLVKKLEAEKNELERELSKYQITIPIAPPTPGARTFVFEQEAEKSYAA